MEFDLDTAIEARLATRSEAEKERFIKYQEEQRSKLVPSNQKSTFGSRMVQMAFDAFKEEIVDEELEYERMAEGYALQGDFETAYVLTTNREKEEFYKRVIDAPDAECEHGKMFLYDEYPTCQLFMCPVCFHLRKC